MVDVSIFRENEVWFSENRKNGYNPDWEKKNQNRKFSKGGKNFHKDGNIQDEGKSYKAKNIKCYNCGMDMVGHIK